MNIKIDKSFERDASKINDKATLNKIADAIESVIGAISISEIKQLKKLKGANNYYRIRIGEFRLGMFIEDDNVEFIRCLQRKDIYKFFP